jgi:prepilin-type N-terminal cleavage/methylation domain-containing protein
MHLAGNRGFTLIEMLTTVAILGIVLAVALPHLDRRRMDINKLTQSLVGDIRLARLRAITGGAHYAVKATSGIEGNRGYEVVQMEETGDGDWVEAVDGWKRVVPLSSGMSVSGGEEGFSVEFNTRGMLVSSEVPVAATITDDFGAVRNFTVWPLGQVHVD